MNDRGIIEIAVVGAHLTGQPLNGQLTERGATLVKTTRTAPDYELYVLKGTIPLKPGLKRVSPGTGNAIEVEVWAMPMNHVGSFIQLIPEPLGIGTLRLADETTVKGFICEPYALEAAELISSYGGWRGYLSACSNQS